MKLFKVDTKNWTVREVEGEPWPGRDSDDEKCHDNTHFKDESNAWERLQEEVSAYVSLSGSSVASMRLNLAAAERRAGDAAMAFVHVQDQLLARA